MPTSTMEINEIVDDGPATRNDTVNDAGVTPMANVDNDVTPSFRVTPSCILIVSLWLVVVLCPPINVLKLPTLTSVYLCE